MAVHMKSFYTNNLSAMIIKRNSQIISVTVVFSCYSIISSTCDRIYGNAELLSSVTDLPMEEGNLVPAFCYTVCPSGT